jgi:outer membrane immunogenic protein
MSLKKTFAVVVAGVALAAIPVFSQEDVSYRSDATVQALGSFVKSTTNNVVEQGATNSGGVLASYRFFFDRHSGVEVNYGYALNTQTFVVTAGSAGVKNYAHEASADYVFRFPGKRLTPFVLAGAGGLVFDPKDVSVASTQARAAFVYGGGADFSFSNHIFVRVEYRGFVYNSPTFDVAGLSGTDRVTHRAEPSIGFGYRF